MRHHYIPCFYTKRWAGVDNKLCEYSRPYKSVKPRRVAPAGTGYQDDLYLIPHLDEDKQHILETKFMKELDQKASDILDKLETRGTNALGDIDRIFWATFLISLMQRNPERVKELNVKAGNVLREIVAKLRYAYAKERGEGDPEKFEQFEQRAIYEGHFERYKALALQDAILIPRSIQFLSGFYWGVCAISSYQHELLSSDRPLIMSNGLGASDGHIAFPIGPRKLFLAARNSTVMQQILVRKDLVAATNNLIVQQAQRYVYGTTDAQLLFVERRLRA